MSERPLRPWVITKPDIVILGAQCDCMAGLDACTHIAALLFSISTSIQIRDSRTVTEKASYWMIPAALKSVQYKQTSEINFQSAKTAKRKLDEKIEAASRGECLPVKALAKTVTVPPATHEDCFKFLWIT